MKPWLRVAEVTLLPVPKTSMSFLIARFGCWISRWPYRHL
jgi:hypothetical protein